MTDKRDRVAPALKIHTTLLFDLDGVLVDSGASVGRCWQRWATERALPPDKIEELAHGRPARDVVREFAPELDPVAEEKRLTELQIEDSADVTAIPGAAEVLAALPPRSWAVVTSCPRDLALTRIRRAKLTEPDVLITADDVKDGKPAPEGYLLAAHKLGVPPSSCLVLEDAPLGIKAGRAAGMSVAALSTTFPTEALADADLQLGSLADLTSYVSLTPYGTRE